MHVGCENEIPKAVYKRSKKRRKFFFMAKFLREVTKVHNSALNNTQKTNFGIFLFLCKQFLNGNVDCKNSIQTFFVNVTCKNANLENAAI